MIRSCFLLFVFICALQLASAQSHNYDLISMEDGLPSNNIYRVNTDSKGYVWFLTDRGIARYDGCNMKIFTTADGLVSNDIWQTWEDTKGRIWLYSFAKKMQFIEGDSVVTAWEKEMANDTDNFVEKDGIVYSSDSKYLRWYSDGKAYQQEIKDEGIRFSHVLSNNVLLVLDANERYKLMWLDKPVGYRQGTKEVPDIYLSFGKFFVQEPYLFYLVYEENLMIYRWNWKENKRIGFNVSDLLATNIDDVIVGKVGGLVQICSSIGYVCLDSNLVLKDKFVLPQSASSKIGDFISKDKEDIIFRTRKSIGVFILPQQKLNSIHLENLNKYEVSYLGLNKEKKLLVGYMDGSVFELAGNNLSSKIAGEKTPFNAVRGIESLDKGYEIFRADGFLSCTDFFEKKYVRNVKRCGSLKDVFWNRKLDWHSFSGGVGISISKSETAKELFVKGRQYATAITDDSIIWAGGPLGLSYIHLDTLVSLTKEDKLYGKTVTQIALDKDQNVWVGTDGFGVYCYQNHKPPILVKGCAYDIVLDLKLGPSGALWAATNHGIKKILIADQGLSAKVVKTYTTADGLTSEVFSRIAVTDSMLYAGSDKGIDILYFNRVRKYLKPKLYIKQVLVNGQNRDSLALQKLSFKENNLTIVYEGVSLASKIPLTYRYYIDGFTLDTLATHENTINLNHFPKGKYKMVLFAQDQFGNRSKRQEVLFFIAKPWYARWWAYLIYFALLSGLVYLVVLYNVGKARKKEIVKKRIAELELHALQSQLNPHFIFNALGAIQQYQYGDKAEDAEEYFSGFARLMRLYLESSKQPTMPLKDELELIQLYINLELLRFGDKFTADIKVDDALELEHINIPSMVLQPFVENAINHGLFHKIGSGHLFISIEKLDEDWICVLVKDDGVGRILAREFAKESHKNHKSRAMQIIEERLKIMNTSNASEIKIDIIDLYDDAGEPIGTEVKIKLPSLD